MKNHFSFNFTGLLTVLLLLFSSFSTVNAQQFLLIDKTFNWNETTGGDGCYGYHFWYDLGQATTSNWKTPFDYENGLFYIRYQIISQPTLPGGGYQPFGISFCIWADRFYEGSKWKETCSLVQWFNGPGSVVETSETPANWWKLNGGIDWTGLDRLWRFGNPFWIDASCQLASEHCTCADPSVWNNERGKYLPIDIRMTIVAVAAGQTFLGWDYYLNGGSPVQRHPTPTYGVDFAGESTNKVVPSTDEYAYNSAMTGAVSGSGSALSLTPGQNVYFRTKASGEYQASFVQTLTVPSRPAAPTFAWDQANQRTSTVVSSDYEYSTSSNMSGAVSGSGTYVAIPSGSTMYFRKKATGSAFKSNIQTLQGVAVTEIGPEFVIINQIIDFPNTTDDNGFYFFGYNASMPSNWTTAQYNYYNGQVYTRYEIISQATSTPVGLQFGIWQKLPVETGTLYESMAGILTLNGPGSVATANSSPNTWWTYNGGVDYTQMDKVWHFGINPWKLTTPSNLQIRQENPAVWAERFTYWFPMQVKVTVVAVASGYTFSGWSNYITSKPATPTYGIDYINEQTNKIVPSTDEYAFSSNMSGAVSGTGSKITLTPGQTCYFRTKAQGSVPASDIQTLVVPARPATPSFAVDYAAENTATAVSAEYQYSTQSNMASASTGTGAKVAVTPGVNLYFRKTSTAAEFASAVQTLTVPARPATPSFAVDYAAENTAGVVSSEYEYSTQSNMASASAGTGVKVAVTPGTNLYFRKKATAGSFISAVQTLTVPARPATPSFTVDFNAETLAENVSADYEYSTSPSMSGAVAGSGSKPALAPGTNLYIRVRSTASQFASAVQAITIASRPSTPLYTVNFTAETTNEPVPATDEYDEDASMAGAVPGTGSVVALNPGNDLFFRTRASGSAFAGEKLQLTVPARPTMDYAIADTLRASYFMIAINLAGDKTGFGMDDIETVNCSITEVGALICRVEPSAPGPLSLKIRANAMTAGNFASDVLEVYYKPSQSGINRNEIDGNLLLYPSPVKDNLVISMKAAQEIQAQVVLLDLYGRTITTCGIHSGSAQIDCSGLTNGVYMVKVILQGQDVITRKIIKE